MASAIDATKPVAGSPTTQSVRDNFATAASEITALQTAPNQTITLSGDIAGSGTAAITTTLATVNANVGTFQGLTVNAKGLVTAAVAQGYITGNQTITASGDATGSGTTALPLTLATVNSNVGTFQGLTINAKGLVTAATNQSYVTGGPYLATAGGTMTGVLNCGNAGAFSDPVQLNVGSGNYCRVLTTVNTVRTWSSGTNTVGKFTIGDQTLAVDRMAIDLTGNCFNTTGTWSTISDAATKQDIAPYTRGLDAILALEPVQFRYRPETPFTTDQPSDLRFGLIADDVKPVIPEIVGEGQWTMGGKEETLSTLAPGDLIYVLINAVKELKAELDALKAGSG